MNVSIYANIKDVKTSNVIDFEMLLDRIRTGFWQDLIFPIRIEKDKEKRQELKKKIPNVTISGIFPERRDSECKLHSGLIAVDMDDLDNLDRVKVMLAQDQYVYAVFVSVSGYGLCAIFKIE